jgi:hypothetical protein
LYCQLPNGSRLRRQYGSGYGARYGAANGTHGWFSWYVTWYVTWFSWYVTWFSWYVTWYVTWFSRYDIWYTWSSRNPRLICSTEKRTVWSFFILFAAYLSRIVIILSSLQPIILSFPSRTVDSSTLAPQRSTICFNVSLA